MAEKADAFLEKNVMKVLGNAGEMVKEGAKVSSSHAATACSPTLQPARCSTLQHAAARCSTLQRGNAATRQRGSAAARQRGNAPPRHAGPRHANVHDQLHRLGARVPVG